MDYLTDEDAQQLPKAARKRMHIRFLTGSENIGPLEKYGRHGFFDGKEAWETREPIDTDRIYQRGGVYIYQRKPLTDFYLGPGMKSTGPRRNKKRKPEKIPPGSTKAIPRRYCFPI